MTLNRAVDLFSGGGAGWCLAMRALGGESIGLEWDAPSCATRAVVGLPTIRTDVASYPAERFIGKVDGVTGSPPCQSFSSAGKRKGMADPRGQMVHEPMRYVRAVRPRWVALEQVPEVLSYWRWIAQELAIMGYSTWAGILNAADYGVPQIRKRAILLASLDRQAVPPPPTHSEHGAADLFGGQLPKWVTMAEALGWDGVVHTQTQTGSGDERHETNSVGRWKLDTRRDQRPDGSTQTVDFDHAAPSVTAKSGGQWLLRSPGRSYGAPPRRAEAASELAPTIALGHNASAWCWERPATTIPATFGNAKGGKGMVAPPGHHTTGTYTEEKGAIPVEPWELGVLNGFPADHPWQPPRVSAQIGNAIPPPLAEACLRSLIGPV